MPDAMIHQAIDQLSAIYDESIANLRAAIRDYVVHGRPPASNARASGAFAYPELRVHYSGTAVPSTHARSFARFDHPGDYASSIARPELFRDYLAEQLRHLVDDYGAEISVGRSSSEIAYPFALDNSGIDMGNVSAAELSRHLPSSELSLIGDEVVDGTFRRPPQMARPLALFDGPRTEFSLARLRHYTGTEPGDFQRFILFTNYARYVDEFIGFGRHSLARGDSEFERLVMPGERLERGAAADLSSHGAAARFQMPAYHLIGEGRRGITLVNIGVGPSNAKTICDNIAVLRPEAWLMIGHCGGLRSSQAIGDYVLAHAYLRDDHVLDDILPPEIPLPAIAEVQQALFKAAQAVTGEDEDRVKRRLRTGTVVTTDDRNWELRYSKSALRFNQSRAVAIDMESATVAAQGYRFRVPYGTLLCVSDKPLHGELKLPGQASDFYERAISQHLRIGMTALELLEGEGEGLHSRKLRSFDEPPLR